MSQAKGNRFCPAEHVLQDYCQGKLDLASLPQLEEHLDSCNRCQELLARLEQEEGSLVKDLRSPPPELPYEQEEGLHRVMATELSASDVSESSAPIARVGYPERDSDTERSAENKSSKPRTSEDFVLAAVSNQILSMEMVEKVVQSLPRDERPTTAKEIARHLVDLKLLTRFQARAIYQGRAKSLRIVDRVVLDLIGKGGMGSVFKARHLQLNRIEALKLISSKRLSSPDAKQRFEREAWAAAQVQHPNVVTTYDAGQGDGVHYLAMEYIEGSNLAAYVAERGKLPVEQALNCIFQAAAGLAAAHERGIVHRDIKPHNLLIDKSGHVKVLDLGLARVGSQNVFDKIHAGLTQSGQLMGTVDYMSPEQSVDVRSAGPAADVYSLGCTLHFLLTGQPPYQAEALGAILLAHHQQPIPSLRTNRSDVPPELDAVFQKMLAKRVEERFGSMADVITALKELGAKQSSLPAPNSHALEESAQADSFLSDIDTQDARHLHRHLYHWPVAGWKAKLRSRTVAMGVVLLLAVGLIIGGGMLKSMIQEAPKTSLLRDGGSVRESRSMSPSLSRMGSDQPSLSGQANVPATSEINSARSFESQSDFSLSAIREPVPVMNGRGLVMKLFQGDDLRAKVAEVITKKVDYMWDNFGPEVLVPTGSWSCQWEGWIKSPGPGTYDFVVRSHAGFRVWVDGKKVVDAWDNRQLDCFNFELLFGQDPRLLRIEFTQDAPHGYEIYFSLQVESLSGEIAVPPEWFFTDRALASRTPVPGLPATRSPLNRLRVEYYEGLNFDRLLEATYQQRIDEFGGCSSQFGTVHPDEFSVRWVGWLVLPQKGPYSIYLVSDNPAKLVLDGQTLIRCNHRIVDKRGYLHTTMKGGAYPLQVGASSKGTSIGVTLRWKRPGSEVDEVIPPQYFFLEKPKVD